MPDDRNAQISSNITVKNANKRIPKYKMGDDNVIKISNDKQRYYLDIAAKIATKSPVYTHKHGAIIVHKDNVISSGYNFYIKGNSMHAEVSAISKINKKYKGILNECDIYVVRIGPNSMDNPLKYSRPCLDCESTITKYNIKNKIIKYNDLSGEELLKKIFDDERETIVKKNIKRVIPKVSLTL